MTPEQKKELGVRVVKAFPELFPDAWKHDFRPTFLDTRWPSDKPKYIAYIAQCKKCEKGLLAGETSCRVIGGQEHIYTPSKPTSCTVPDPIDVDDWNVAMKLVRATKKVDIFRVLLSIWRENTEVSVSEVFIYWLLFHATPADYIEAAIKAKEKE